MDLVDWKMQPTDSAGTGLGLFHYALLAGFSQGGQMCMHGGTPFMQSILEMCKTFRSMRNQPIALTYVGTRCEMGLTNRIS